MILKPNILICSSSRFAPADLLCAATPEGTIPENDDDTSAPAPDTGIAQSGDDDPDEKPMPLVRRFIETPVANFVEANDLSELGEDGIFPENLSMGDYVKKVGAELRSNGRLSDEDAKIDVVWYCVGGEMAFMDESEKDFMRSAAAVPNALVVASPSSFSGRPDFKKAIGTLTELARPKRIVVAPSICVGMNLSTHNTGLRRLVGRTVRMYLDSIDAPDGDKEAFEAAWNDFYGEKFDEWQEDLEDSLSNCVRQAAGRANFILGRPRDMSLTDLVGEGVDLLAELIEILRDGADTGEKPRKQALAHTAELKDNIEIMICEIAACCGIAATDDDVGLVFRHSRASTLPKDAAAVTYAVAQVAKALFEPEAEYGSKDLLMIYREAKEKAMRMMFRPYDDADPFTFVDSDFELNDEDVEDSDGEEDADGANFGAGTADDVHEPADELPDDCKVDCEDGCKAERSDIKAVLDRYLLPDDPPVMVQALKFVLKERQISTSSLQRELGIGYNRAAGIIDKLEQRHVIGPYLPGGQKRSVLIHGESNKNEN